MYYLAIQHNTIWCLRLVHATCMYMNNLNRRSKKRPERESETEYSTSKASGTREEKSRRKKKKKKKKGKTATCWKKRSKKKGTVRGTWGQYVAVCSVSNSPLTHNPFATVSQPFRIKCERYVFLKKFFRS